MPKSSIDNSVTKALLAFVLCDELQRLGGGLVRGAHVQVNVADAVALRLLGDLRRVVLVGRRAHHDDYARGLCGLDEVRRQVGNLNQVAGSNIFRY